MAQDCGRLVIDALVYFCDGDPAPLRAGGVTAANVTVTDMRHGLEATFDGLADWLDRLAQPQSPWLLVRTADDIVRAHAGSTAQQLVDAVFAGVEAYRDDAPQNDDMTTVVLRITG